MRPPTLFRRIFTAHILILLVAFGSVGISAIWALAAQTRASWDADLSTRARLAAAALQPPLARDDWTSLRTTIARLEAELGLLVDVAAAETNTPAHNSPASQSDTITGRVTTNERASNEQYVASVPVTGADGSTALVTVRPAPATYQRPPSALRIPTLSAGLALLLAVTVLSWATARSIRMPIATIGAGARRAADGPRPRRVWVSSVPEFAALSKTINRFIDEMDRRIADANQHRVEQEAVLSSMEEGVLAVDANGLVIAVNHAAGNVLGISPQRAQHLSLEDAVSNPDIQQFTARVLNQTGAVQSEIVLGNGAGDVLELQGTRLRGGQGALTGAVVVLQNVTRLRKLEQVRRDFVANVSHELKTPITTIKGFVETLHEEPAQQPERTHRFLTIVAKHAKRLNAIIEDLLTLSHIDEDDTALDHVFETGSIQNVLDAAAQLCHRPALEKNIAVEVRCPPELKARINPQLLEQAVVNLVDNAIKYSGAGTHVTITGGRRDGRAYIDVTDEGSGIAPEHIERLFDRFYRVDKSDSRRMGGTGLGLAIVRRIAQAHGGEANVSSTPGRGSTFTLTLPD